MYVALEDTKVEKEERCGKLGEEKGVNERRKKDIPFLLLGAGEGPLSRTSRENWVTGRTRNLSLQLIYPDSMWPSHLARCPVRHVVCVCGARDT